MFYEREKCGEKLALKIHKMCYYNVTKFQPFNVVEKGRQTQAGHTGGLLADVLSSITKLQYRLRRKWCNDSNTTVTSFFQ